MFPSSGKKSAKKATPVKKNVQVVVRARPLNDAEREAKAKNVVALSDDSRQITIKSAVQRPFGPFDQVYGPDATQRQIYRDVVAPLVKEVLSGYNCTVFAYGQTGSGKTYTMEGRHHHEGGGYCWEDDPVAGIIPRLFHHIFTVLDEQELDYYSVRASYVEMYNEHIYDLLSRSSTSHQESLRIYDDKNKGVIIAGMEEVAVRNRNEVYNLLKRGAEKRRTATTLMNINSSRSHSVFTVTVLMRETSGKHGDEILRQGKINLVDLAGSENIGRSGATDMRAREAGNINVSLLSLGRVISALTTSAAHIPYRESKLTRILQDSLGGKTITTIIATLSPASTNVEETMNTLDYAQRAKIIRNVPEANAIVTRKALLEEYNGEIERLRRDLEAAREKDGFFIDSQNYEQMVVELEDQKGKIEELECQLQVKVHQAQTLLDDMKTMDEHYQRVYEKCALALVKLEKRREQLEGLNKDIATTADNLKAANNALGKSSNAFVKLRSQASTIRDTCSHTWTELEKMHERHESVKRTSAKNEDAVKRFVAERTQSFDEGIKELHAFDTSNAALVDKNDELLVNVAKRFEGAMAKCFENAMAEVSNHVKQSLASHKAAGNEQKVLARNAVRGAVSKFGESMRAVDRFATQEFERVISTHETPVRRSNPVQDVHFVDLEPAAVLLQQQKIGLTPRPENFHRVNDSLLDAERELPSPTTLRGSLAAVKTGTVDELAGAGSQDGDDKPLPKS